MKRFMAVSFGVMAIAGLCFAQTISNTITAPSGDVCIDCDPYAATLTGVANASGTSTDLEIVITLDQSGSISNTNWTLEKNGAAYLVDQLRDPNDPTKLLADVGVVRFNSVGQAVIAPPSDDYAFVRNTILGLVQAGGGTNFNNAIAATNAVFSMDGHADEEICFFFSDGYGGNGLPAMTTAHADGILFNAYGLGTAVDVTQMQKIAGTTDAADPTHYFSAPTFEALQTAIDNSLPSTGSISLSKVEVYDEGVYMGDATIGVGGNYSYAVALNSGANNFSTKAIATDGTFAWATTTANGVNCNNVPEPASASLIALSLISLIGLGIRRKK